MGRALLTVTLLVALAAASGALAGPTATTASCKKQCFVDVTADRFKAVGAGASGSALTMTAGATVRWRLKDDGAHSVVAAGGLFRFGTFLRGTDLSFTLTPSAGRYDYRDRAGGAGRGTLVVLPRFDRQPDGSYTVTWTAPGAAPPDRVHHVRWLLIQGADVVEQGTWQLAGRAGSRVFHRNDRLKSAAALTAGRSLCVEVRTARGTPRRWSDWANACVVV